MNSQFNSITVIMLLLFSGSAYGEWTYIANSDDKNHYIDFATIRTNGHLRKVWELWDYKLKGKYGELSILYRSEIDCNEETTRLLASVYRDEHMGQGNTVWTSDNVGNWFAIPPGSIGESILKISCSTIP